MAVAVTVSAKSTSLSAGGVTDRLVSVQSVTSTVVLPRGGGERVAPPSVSVAPTGTSLISSVSVSLPSVSVSDELIVNAALLRVFVHRDRRRHGQRRLIGHGRHLHVDRVGCECSGRRCRFRRRGGHGQRKVDIAVGRRCDRADCVSVQVVTSTVVLPLEAVNVWLPSVSVAPTGTSLISSFSVSLPSVSVSAELIAKRGALRVFIDGDRGRYGQRRLIGDRRHLDIDRVDASALIAVGGFRGGRGHGQGKVDVAVGRRCDRQIGQRPARHIDRRVASWWR